MHTLILIINGTKDKEVILKQSRDSNWLSLGLSVKLRDGLCFVISEVFGIVHIYGETAYWAEERVLFDKNMILMLKDMCIGRFMTLNILTGSNSPLIPSLEKIFFLGDQLLENVGNNAFDAIKLIEPICVKQWLKIASRSDYDQSSEDKFGEHITRCEDGMTPASVLFLRTTRALINNISDSDEVGTIFGSFRLCGHPFICYREG